MKTPKAKGMFQGQQKINNDSELLRVANELYNKAEIAEDNNFKLVSGIWSSIDRAIATVTTMSFAIRNIWQAIMLTRSDAFLELISLVQHCAARLVRLPQGRYISPNQGVDH